MPEKPEKPEKPDKVEAAPEAAEAAPQPDPAELERLRNRLISQYRGRR